MSCLLEIVIFVLKYNRQWKIRYAQLGVQDYDLCVIVLLIEFSNL